MKNQLTKVTSNPIGSIAGGLSGWYVAKKLGKVSNNWILAASVVAGIVIGANIQSRMAARSSQPTTGTVTGK